MTNFNATQGHPISGITLNSGDFAFVSSGGVATGVTLNDGSGLTVYSGGVASASVLSGGFETISSGGVASFGVVRGGVEVVNGGGTASFTVVSSAGTEAVHSGGQANNNFISGGLEEIYAGGQVSGGMLTAGGLEEVYSGGNAIGTNVSSGGQFVYSAGTAIGAVLGRGGTQTLYLGGTASNTVVSAGGIQILAGGSAAFTVVSRGGMIDLEQLTYVSGGSAVVGSNDLLSVTEGGSSATIQLAGTYVGETFQTAPDNATGTMLTLIEPPRTLVWSETKDADFANAANWDDLTNGTDPAALPPNETDTAEFLAGPSTITGTGTAAALEFGGAVLWNVTSGASLSAAVSVTVGKSGSGGLLINNGAGIRGLGATDSIFGGSGGSASVTVDGAGSTWTSTGELVVDGGLTISGKAGLSAAASGSSPALSLGAAAGDTGSLLVTGAGSHATLVGQLDVGQVGGGTVTISNLGAVTTGDDAALDPAEGVDIAQGTGASGQVTVTGTKSLLSNSGRFVVGDAGVGGLAVLSGGSVVTTPGTLAGLAGMVIANTASASGSSVNVSGTGSTLGVGGLLDVGVAGSGSLQLSGGATVTAGSLDAGNIASAVGQIGVIGTGTSLNITGAAIVADDGTGVLSVLNGATLSAASLTIGSTGNSSGAVVVSGNGSVINLSGALNIGTALGTGDLTVGPGAAVHASVVNQQGQVVLEGGLLDPTVNLIGKGHTVSGFGTILAADIIDEGMVQTGGSRNLMIVRGTVLGGGTLTVNGTVQPSSAVGLVRINSGGTLELTGAVLNAPSTTFTDDLAQQSTYTVNNSVVDVSFSTASGELLLDDIAEFGGTISAYQPGNMFVITGGTLSNLGVVNGTTLTVQDSGAGAGAGGIDRIMFASAIDPASLSIVNGNTIVACFAAGTRIGTAQGEVRVEDLRVGDMVLTVDGSEKPMTPGDRMVPPRGAAAAVVWIGARAVACERHPKPETVWPVRINAGAFGRNVPVRDLYLSPDHAVFVDGVLVPVKLLINGTSIVQTRRPRVTYYHVELPMHALILAEGLAVESYLDVGDRANFADQDTVRLFPDFDARLAPDVAWVWETKGAAKLVIAGDDLERVRRMNYPTTAHVAA